MKLTITPKNQANTLDSNLRFKLKSGFSNSIFFNIKKPAQGSVTPPEPESIDNARLTSSLDIVASDYDDGGNNYIKYDLTLTVSIMGIRVSNNSQSYSTSVLCNTAQESVTLGVGPWDFEFNGTTYSTSDIKIEGSDSTWAASGEPMNPNINFVDNTLISNASYSGGTGTWDVTATVEVTCFPPI